MWRKVLVTVGILCFLSSAKAQADDVYAYCPLGEGYVFLYDSPAGFQVIANLKCGAKLTVVDASDRDRARVRTADGKEGYVMKSSITAPPPSAPRQPAPSPNTSAQQPQLPPPPTPVSQPQPQSKPQPLPKAQAQPEPPSPPKPQPDVQSQVQPEPAPAQSQPAQALPVQAQPAPEQPKQPEPQALPEPQPQALPMPQRQAQPELTSQPEPQPQLEARSEPVAPIPPEPAPEEQPKPEAQPKPKSEPEVKAERQSQSRTQQPGQPEPAAVGFTPFSSLGYEASVPRLEFYGGYMFLNAGTSGLASRQNVSGVESSVAFHINRWLAAEADFGLGYKTLQILSVGTFPFHDYLGLAGPRINIRKAFFHVLAGMDHLAGSNNFYAVTTKLSDNSIAAAAGGGVQWNVSRRLALRASGDYVMTRFEGLMQHNVRATVGIVFQVGSVEAR